MFILDLQSPLGLLKISGEGEIIYRLEFLGDGVSVISPANPLANNISQQFAAYFRDAKNNFDLPLLLAGTPFQRKVWRALREIPTGKVLTYGELAERLKTSARAVGNACRKNPVPVIVPCHRVVSANGLGGYCGEVGGEALAIKRQLLRHEGVEC
ncbi:MAG: methylated-DNA--[protein]-cysteine S-methyltransferase [Gammaproteobacteria bacterium]|nr:methylated-DNA--[protein]-cysteine S-methyltransferase [Gammaproteobacteria bacterium]